MGTCSAAKIDKHCIDFFAIRVGKHKIELITSTTEKYEFRGTMKECLNQLKEESFFRVNSGAIVNLRYAKKFEDSYIVMEDNNIIQISREKKKECKERFMKCWRESI